MRSSEEQARDFTLGWPVLRACVRRLGEHMVATGAIEQTDDVFFCNREEVTPLFGLKVSRSFTWCGSAATCGSANATSSRP